MSGKRRRRRAARRRNDKERIQINILPKHVMFVLCFLCGVIMFVSYRFPAYMQPVKNVIDMAVFPMQRGINHIGARISDSFKRFEDLEKLRKENEELRSQIEDLTAKSQMTNQDRYELDALRKLYELDGKYTDYPKVAARIIARESNGWYRSFTLDKGSNDGIKKNMNVIAGNGLVGIVSDVRKSTCIVRAIIDDNSSVSGMFSSSGDTCIVTGSMNSLKNDGVIPVSMISLNASVINNEEVVVSHISDRYLPGILIGYVKDVYVDSSNMTKAAVLVPAVDFEHLDEVLVITVLKETEE
ncbi:MAG: rod shape-determining protein MreC [Lachnospiraceae bacterium]|nr:rod shape-determining protein MreC [Lachnospiraceae bacterium]